MYEKIKQLADDALALQNKDRMDAALREISALAAAGQHAYEAAVHGALATGSAILQYSVQNDSEGKITIDAAHVPMTEQLDGADQAEGGAQ